MRRRHFGEDGGGQRRVGTLAVSGEAEVGLVQVGREVGLFDVCSYRVRGVDADQGIVSVPSVEMRRSLDVFERRRRERLVLALTRVHIWVRGDWGDGHVHGVSVCVCV